MEDEQYYLATERNLLQALADPSAVTAVLEHVRAIKLGRVLDVGCGIGQALLPLAAHTGANGVGVDVSPLGLRMGRKFYATHLPEAHIEFIRAPAEKLPFATESFDLVNCGLALPYMHNAQAIAEAARVLRRDGIFLLKIHHARYYLREAWQALKNADLLAMIYSGRVLVAGTLYHLVRRQPRTKLFNESYQTRWLLQRELAKHGMFIEREQVKTNPLTPAFVIRKK
jgi:ubiquinone/menaquinone biosynthesis C-methylase UbiE